MPKKNRVFYTYPVSENFISYALCLLAMGLSLTLGVFAGWVIVVNALKEGDNIFADFGAWLAVVIIVGMVCGLCVLLMNLYPAFWISQNGLTIRMFPFGSRFVPWNNLVRISPFILANSQLVVLNRLSIMHRLIGVFTGLTSKPSFRIKQSLLNYQDAIETIRQHVHN